MKSLQPIDKIRNLVAVIGYTNSQIIDTVVNLYVSKYKKTRVRTERTPIYDFWGKLKRTQVETIQTEDYSKCISLLSQEIYIRSNLSELKSVLIENNTITATDISNFTFCPVSYAIGKSFIIETDLNKTNQNIGASLHEEMRVLFKSNKFQRFEKERSTFSELQIEFLRKVNSCKLVYSSELNPNKIFKNNKIDFIGKPDYIFEDLNGKFFVVEEKFHYSKTSERKSNNNLGNKDFFENNILQLKSYINYINDYNIEYGVLINWYYHLIDPMGQFASVEITDFTYKIYKKGSFISTDEKISYIRKLQFGIKINFDCNTINLNKCLSCSVNMYCGHKTGRFQDITLPYSTHHLKI